MEPMAGIEPVAGWKLVREYFPKWQVSVKVSAKVLAELRKVVSELRAILLDMLRKPLVFLENSREIQSDSDPRLHPLLLGKWRKMARTPANAPVIGVTAKNFA